MTIVNKFITNYSGNTNQKKNSLRSIFREWNHHCLIDFANKFIIITTSNATVYIIILNLYYA